MKTLLNQLVSTPHNRGLLLLRLGLAVVIFPHGAQKLLGWFGGFGAAGTLEYLTGPVGLPVAIAGLVIFIEFFGPLALAIGLVGRLAALGIMAVMIGAVATAHAQVGFFMNWAGQLPAGSEGFEFHILALAMSAVLVAQGSGAFSIDRYLSKATSEGAERNEERFEAARQDHAA